MARYLNYNIRFELRIVENLYGQVFESIRAREVFWVRKVQLCPLIKYNELIIRFSVSMNESLEDRLIGVTKTIRLF